MFKQRSFASLSEITSNYYKFGYYRWVPIFMRRFFLRSKVLKKGINLFPCSLCTQYVKGQVDELLSEEKYLCYAILVFFLLRDNSLKVVNLEELLKYKTEIIKFGGMVGDISPKKIIKASIKGSLKDMLDIFIIQCERGYRLKHMIIFEAVLLSFGENFPEEFLKLVSKSVLLTYVRSKGYVPERHEVIIQFDENLTEYLAKKLIEVYGSNKEEPSLIFTVIHHFMTDDLWIVFFFWTS